MNDISELESLKWLGDQAEKYIMPDSDHVVAEASILLDKMKQDMEKITQITPKKEGLHMNDEENNGYTIGQTVYFMEQNKPVARKIFAVIVYEGGQNFIFSRENSPSDPDKFWLHRNLNDNSKYIKYKSEIFATKDDLMDSLFRS